MKKDPRKLKQTKKYEKGRNGKWRRLLIILFKKKMLIMMLALHWKQEEGFCFIHDGFLILGDFFQQFQRIQWKMVS